MSSPPAVLVGGSANAVPVARSLGQAGVHVIALGRDDDAVRWSRYLGELVDLGAGEGAPGRWLAWLLDEAPAGAVVLPCADAALEIVAEHREALERRGLVPVEMNEGAVSALLDKQRTFDIASRAGVSAPLVVPIASEDDLLRASERVGYPCALKPAHSHRFAHHFDRKLFVARSAAELKEAHMRAAELGLRMSVTEIVPGPDSDLHAYYAYLDEAGDPLCELTGRKLRQLPIHFGVGTYRLTDWDPEVVEVGLRFLRAARVRGLAQVELKRDARDGRLRLIECNLRFTGGTANVHAAGFDIGLFVYRRLTGGTLPTMNYRLGVHSWNPIADTKAFLAYRRAGELSTRQWLRSLCHRQSFFVARRDDPVPTLLYHWVRVRRRLWAWLRRQGAAAPSTGIE